MDITPNDEKRIGKQPAGSVDGLAHVVLSPASLRESEAIIQRMIETLYVDLSGRAEPISDGVINVELWCSSPLRVMWILKEPWDGEDSSGGGWSICADVLNVKPVSELGHTTWHPIIYIAFGLFNNKTYAGMPCVRDMNSPEGVLRRLAFINVKKLPGVRWGAYTPGILDWYIRGRKIILEQIRAYCPHVVFACSPNFPAILNDLDCGWRSRLCSVGSAAYVWHENVLFVHVYHPGQTQITRENYVNDALAAVWQAMGRQQRSGKTRFGHESDLA